MPQYLPDEKDRQRLQWMLDQIRNMPGNRPLATSTGLPVQPSTGAYVAKVPVDGIPALSESGTGTTTGTGTDSGPVEPGSAICDLYRIIQMPDGSPDRLVAYEGLRQKVYNISTTGISEGYVVVNQLKEGKWIALIPGGSSLDLCNELRNLPNGDNPGAVRVVALDVDNSCILVDVTECEELGTGTGSGSI